MMKILKFIWRHLLRAGLMIENIIIYLALFTFYYTIFLAFAVPFRLFNNPLAQKTKDSNWRVKKTTPETLEDFINE